MEELTKEKIKKQLQVFENVLGTIGKWMKMFFEAQNKYIGNIPPDIYDEEYFFGILEYYEEYLKEINKIFTMIRVLKVQDYDNICEHYAAFWKSDIQTYKFNEQSMLTRENESEFREIFHRWEKSQFKNIKKEIEECDRISDILMEEYGVIKNKIYALTLMDKIKDINNNIILIGANGSGKSTYSRALSETMSDNISLTILASQHYLRYTLIGNWNQEDSWNDLRYLQKNSTIDSQDSYIDELPKLIHALVEEYISYAVDYYEGKEKRQSKLEKILRLWNEFFPEIELKIDKYKLYPEKDGIEYDFNELSDGEKTVFYYIAHVITSEKNAYIVIDEPENHMNTGLSKRLWNRLEIIRGDCKFIYITHDLEFATTRLDATIMWNKKYISPIEWDVERITSIDNLPEQLVLEILGTKSKLIFCEGKENSYDKKLYALLYPDYTIIGVGNHKNVIKYVNVYKTQKIFNYEVIGIIDRDWHSEEWCNKLTEGGIYPLKINEIENILCDQNIIKKVIKHLGLDEEKEIEERYMEAFWKKFKERIKEQAKSYTIYQLNHNLKKSLVNEKNNFEEISKSLQEIINSKYLQEQCDEYEKKLEEILEEKNYNKALKIINFKKDLLKTANKKIVSNYDKIALARIRNDEQLRNYIKEQYCFG